MSKVRGKPTEDEARPVCATTARTHRERNAVRPEGYVEAAREGFRAALVEDPSAAGAGREAVRVLRALLRSEIDDPGVELSTRRTRAAQLAAMLAKASEPERRVEDLAADLRAAHSDIESLEERLRADAQPTGDPSGSRAASLQ